MTISENNNAGSTVQITQTAEFNRVFSHRKTRVNNINLHFVAGGSGETAIILLHGWLGTWYSWRKIMLPLAEHFTVVAPDMRGLGDSDKPESGYDARMMAEDVRQLVKQLGLKRVFVVGHDMGAPVAYVFAAQNRENVRGLVYLDEPLPGFNLDRFTAFTPENPFPYWWFNFHSQHNLAETLVAGKEREYLDYFITGMIADQRSITEADKDEYLRTFAAPGGVRGSFGWYRAVFQTAAQIKELAANKLQFPVLGINGEYGHPQTGEQLTAVAENVQSAVIKNCGHLIAEEQPEELVKQLLEFFKAEEK